MLLGISAQAVAIESQVFQTESKIASEIEAKKAEIFAEVYAQLEVQDALSFYDIYIEVLTPQIEFSIMSKYHLIDSYAPLSVSGSPEKISIYFPYGGVLTYTQAGSRTKILQAFFDPDKTDDAIDKLQEMTYVDFLFHLGAQYPGIGTIVDIFNAIIKPFIRAPQRESIKRCDNYSYAMQIDDPVSGASSVVMLGWEGHPYAIIYPDYDKDYDYELFDKGKLNIEEGWFDSVKDDYK